eukprot:TRINITY_DN661_c0_g1_i1.p2 TRINITY_DN661_c0_g1~~TRINITY_DN661_c0_g1_i1.p2  ORF type:complete len:139 (-),score=36.75 TRINITY_DN661_c0_g1_i1:54-470(-)
MSFQSDLVWLCVKNNNAFLRKSKNCPNFSSAPGNLTSLNMKKYSALAHAKPVGVSVRKNGKKSTIIMTTKSTKDVSTISGKNFFAETGVAKGGKTVKGLDKAALLRPDLAEEVRVKYGKIKQSFKKNSNVSKSRRASK